MEVKEFYVYELCNPLTNSVFYVGKGTKHSNGYYRLSDHIKDSRYALRGKIKMTHKFRTILKILDAGNRPEMRIILESYDHEKIIKKEIELIKHYGRRDDDTGILCNHTNGGEGSFGYVHTPEFIHNMKTNNIGGQITSRPILAICPVTFNTIRYASSNAAAIILNGRRDANIHSAATRLQHRIASGFYWRFESEYNPLEDFSSLNELRDNSYTNAKNVNQYDLNNNFIKTWKSASDVCRYYGKNVTTLHRYLKTHTQWQGCLWEYTKS